jgi:hypothetical protein
MAASSVGDPSSGVRNSKKVSSIYTYVCTLSPCLLLTHTNPSTTLNITHKQLLKVRDSRTAWLARHSSAVTDTLYRRLADVLHIDESILHEQGAAESLQVVHYGIGQKYDSHHDWVQGSVPQMRYVMCVVFLSLSLCLSVSLSLALSLSGSDTNLDLLSILTGFLLYCST